MRTCSLCGKKSAIGRNRSHAQNRTPRTYKANIQKVSFSVGEDKISGSFCTMCIKSLKKEVKEQKAELK